MSLRRLNTGARVAHIMLKMLALLAAWLIGSVGFAQDFQGESVRRDFGIVSAEASQMANQDGASAIGAAREAFGDKASLPFSQQFHAHSGVATTSILFPIGSGRVRYLVTRLAFPENGIGGWLVCQERIDGHLNVRWTLNLRGMKVNAPLAGKGTLLRFMSSLELEPAKHIPAMAKGSVRAWKPFACYEFQLDAEGLAYFTVGVNGLPLKVGLDGMPIKAEWLHSDTAKDWPSLGRPYPLPAWELQWLARHE